MLIDLHTHLYGSLTTDDLYWLHSINKPRWEIFTRSYEKAYGKIPDIAGLMNRTGEARERLLSYYHYTDSGDFDKFQASFDLVIALASAEPDELYEISRRVIARQSEDHCEYRMLFPPRGGLSAFNERVHALAEGVRKACIENEKSASIAVSLTRDDLILKGQYEELRRAMKSSRVVSEKVTAIDFCATEEGFPPSDKKDFIETVLDDNRSDPGTALAILYHVGESFKNMSVESSIRWVIEVAEMNVHRLGHAISPGIPARLLEGSFVKESVRDRSEQIKFYIDRFDELSEAGLSLNLKELNEELSSLESLSPDGYVTGKYTENRIRNLMAFQNFATGRLRECGAVIEICPTSNIRIAGLGKYENHPLPDYIDRGLHIVIGSDDPGILNTSLQEEINLAREMTPDRGNFDFLLEAEKFRSEILSGRVSKTDPESSLNRQV